MGGYAATPCYLLAPSDDARRWLRRYVRAEHDGWTCEGGWHEARVEIEGAPVQLSERGTYGDAALEPFLEDPRWPSTCDGCAYEFVDDDHRQVSVSRLYRVAAAVPGAALAVGEATTLRDAPPGAMWFAPWMGERWTGFDGRALVVKLPNSSEWHVDSEASNCTRKGDRDHRCWLRHGEPPFVTVDKSGAQTCNAGAGSILAGDYHGFLRNGILTAG